VRHSLSLRRPVASLRLASSPSPSFRPSPTEEGTRPDRREREAAGLPLLGDWIGWAAVSSTVGLRPSASVWVRFIGPTASGPASFLTTSARAALALSSPLVTRRTDATAACNAVAYPNLPWLAFASGFAPSTTRHRRRSAEATAPGFSPSQFTSSVSLLRPEAPPRTFLPRRKAGRRFACFFRSRSPWPLSRHQGTGLASCLLCACVG